MFFSKRAYSIQKDGYPVYNTITWFHYIQYCHDCWRRLLGPNTVEEPVRLFNLWWRTGIKITFRCTGFNPV